MKSIFEPAVLDELVGRIEALTPSAPRQWGTMSPGQMLEHAARAVEMAMGQGPQRQAFLGKLIGWAVKAKLFGEEPFPRNSPTGPDFIVTGEPEFAAARDRLLGAVRTLHTLGESGCDGHVHRFFGRLRGAEWGVIQFKHLDHHLRQFGL